ncbi:putative transcriptional regulatory protein [Spirochaetota bacterium]|nr:putative transcriptional regulatory protein [Spirochaetota bacterium]
MSGHSKWSTIKHRKGAQDVKRGKLFSKLVKEIVVSAKLGGGDIAANPRLRTAVMKAKAASMPAKNIDNAIKKATGSREGAGYHEVTYEGYGPEGVAILVECLTDNKKRTVSDIRAIFSKNGGSLGQSGSVAWQFEKKGVILIAKAIIEEEALIEKVLAYGGEDVLVEVEGYTVISDPGEFSNLLEKLRAAAIEIESAEITMVPKNFTTIADDKHEKILKLTERLDDLDDVQTVSSNEKVTPA